MKTIFRFFSLAALASGIAVGGAMAQDTPAAANPCTEIDAANASYEKFTANYKKTTKAELQAAVDAGKEYLQKWGACAEFKEQVDFVKPWVPRVEKIVTDLTRLGVTTTAEADTFYKLFPRFDNAINTDNADELYTTGKLILAKTPGDINIMYPMAVVGPREVAKKNLKHNADSLNYAKTLYDKLKGGAELTKKLKDGRPSIGALKHEVTREDALSELTYVLGYMNFYGQNNKKAAMPYYYEVTQLPGFRKTTPAVYATIGDFYLMERTPIGKEIVDLIAKLKAATTDDEKIKIDAEIKAKEALFKGYTERAMDALGRAHSLAKNGTPEEQKYKAGLYKDLQDLYKARFERIDGLDSWISSAVAKPLPDPTTAVQPIVEAETTTTTTSTTGTGTGVGAANGTGVGAAKGTSVGAANGTGVGAASGKTVGTSAATKPVVAKTKPKK